MKFNEGDKVVCISDEWESINIGDIYIIKQILYYKTIGFSVTLEGIYFFKNSKNFYSPFPMDCFISLIECRKNKLLKIKNIIKENIL